MSKSFTICCQANHIICAKFISGGIDQDRIDVYYAATEHPISIWEDDVCFEKYLKTWTEHRDTMLSEGEEKPQDPVGPVDGKES